MILTDDVVERVARAMLAASRPSVDPDDLTPAPRGQLGMVPKWKMYEHLARAALEAARYGELRDASIADVWRQAEDNHHTYSAMGDNESEIRFLTLGLAGEAGELANFVKKRWRDGEGHDEAIRFEIADVCAYAFMLASTMGMTPADLIQTLAHKQQVFIDKMKARALLSTIGEPDNGGRRE